MFLIYTVLPGLCWVRDKDLIYSPLPLYHSAAGVVTMGAAVLEGVMQDGQFGHTDLKKFSARMFWSDCVAEERL